MNAAIQTKSTGIPLAVGWGSVSLLGSICRFWSPRSLECNGLEEAFNFWEGSTLRNCLLLVVLGMVAIGFPVTSQAADSELRKELEMLKKEIEDLRKEKAAARPVGTGVVDQMVDNKYGPNAKVTTKQGKLTIGGLLQVWAYGIQNDNLGFFGDRTVGALGGGDTNEGQDNDSYALRRVRLNFTMDIHENVMAFIQMDLANAFNGRPAFGSNLGTSYTHARPNTPQPNGNNGGNILLDAYQGPRPASAPRLPDRPVHPEGGHGRPAVACDAGLL